MTQTIYLENKPKDFLAPYRGERIKVRGKPKCSNLTPACAKPLRRRQVPATGCLLRYFYFTFLIRIKINNRVTGRAVTKVPTPQSIFPI